MIQTSLRAALIVGISVALLSLGAVGIASYQSNARLLEAGDRVGESHQVLSLLERIHGTLRDAESDQRGYILTGDTFYLDGYERARAELPAALAQLEQQRGGPAVRALRGVIERRIGQLDGRVRIARAGGVQAAIASLRADAEDVSRTSARISALVADLLAAERRQLDRRSAEAARTSREAKRVIVTGSVLAVAIVLAALLALSREVRRRSQAAAMLAQQERLLQQFMEALPLGILVGDHQGGVVYVNKAAQELVGVQAVPGAEYDKLVDVYVTGTDQKYPPERWPITRALQGEAARVADMEIRGEGRSIPLEVTGAPIFDAQGNVQHAIVAFSDISDRRAVERMKDEFLSIVSHELRTPLTSVRGALGLLASGKLGEISAKGERMVEIAVADTDRLVRLINDILDIERMETGRLQLEKERVQAADLTSRAAEALRPLAERCEVTIEVHSEPIELWADGDRVVQALTNLIGNALKFSPRGGLVEVGATVRENEALFYVRDQGRGIPPSKLSSIFERFQQVDGSDARLQGGAGLGLPISRSIVVQHGGRIWAESDGRKGSTFQFTLPLQHESAVQARDFGSAPVILIAEDDASVVEVLRSILLAHGYDVVSVPDGRRAIERARELRPSAIILDMMMPHLDGRAALSAIRQDTDIAQTPVLVLTVLNQKDTPPLEDPISSWLSKPIDPVQLVQALDRALTEQSRFAEVLLVEDDLATAARLKTQFGRRGLNTRCAHSSAQAVRMLKEQVPSAIVLDFMLPDATGFEVVEKVRALGYGELPLVIYSGAAFDAGARARLRLGPTEFLKKGEDDPEEVAHRVSLLLHSSRDPKSDDANGEDSRTGR